MNREECVKKKRAKVFECHMNVVNVQSVGIRLDMFTYKTS